MKKRLLIILLMITALTVIVFSSHIKKDNLSFFPQRKEGEKLQIATGVVNGVDASLEKTVFYFTTEAGKSMTFYTSDPMRVNNQKIHCRLTSQDIEKNFNDIRHHKPVDMLIGMKFCGDPNAFNLGNRVRVTYWQEIYKGEKVNVTDAIATLH